jgi:TonB-dependent starch-binding outer membrane protein SusC
MTKFYLLMRRYLTVALVLGVSVAFAQQTVKGKVTSADDGSGIPGVNILEKGTTNGTVTDADGNYTISVAANSTLVFSFVGYTTQEASVGTQTTVDVKMQSDVTALSEVVVVGYGTQEKKEITSSVSSIKSEDFNRGNVNDVSQLLQGRVPGLNIAREGSNPSGQFNIRLRGLSTVGANSQPLIVIDGVIGAALNSVDPNDIATFDVLKDGSAAAIYGTRGSSGVIIITTKKGKAGKTTVDYNAYVSAEIIARSVPVLSASEFRSFSTQLGVTGNDQGASTDWLKEITRTAMSNVHNLSLSGGVNKTTYRASFNFRDIQGVQVNSGFKQVNGRLNLTQKALNDKLTIESQIAFTSRSTNFGWNDAYRYAAIYNPTAPIIDPNPSSDQAIANGGFYQENRFDYFNPVALIRQNTNEGQFQRTNFNVGANYQVLKDLTVGVNYAFQNEQFLGDRDFGNRYYSKNSLFVGAGRKGLADVRTNNFYNQLVEATANYSKNFGDLNFSALAGYSWQEFINEGFGVQAGNFVTDAFNFNSIGDALDFPNGLAGAYSYKNSNKIIAQFARLNFNYKDTYFLSASVRREGSTKFGVNNKWGIFPAVSGGVNITNLVEIPTVNSLKARVGYGVTGNTPNDSYLSILTFGRSGNAPVNGQYVPGYTPTFNANPNLQWEQKAEINAGIDFSMLNNKLSGSVDYYTRTTTNLLLFQAVPQPPNLASRTWINGGELQNSGIEVALNYAAIQKPDFTWNTGINFATITTKINSLQIEGGVSFQGNVGSPGLNGINMIRVKEGEPVGQLWGLKFTGIGEDGRWQYQDLNGDGKIDDADKQVLGNGLPTVTFGFNNSFTYKRFDIQFLLRGALGHNIINQYRTFYESPIAVTSYNVLKTSKDVANLTESGNFSSFQVEDGSFVKLDNATVGYTFGLPSGSAFSKFRAYITGQNLFVITKYKGVDPEVRYGDSEDNNTPLSPGIDRRNTWVRTATVTVGFNLTF